MELNENHYKLLKNCRDNGSLNFCWDENQQHNQVAWALLSFGYLKAENEKYCLTIGDLRQLMSYDAKLTDKGKNTLNEYEDKERDLKLKIETLAANKAAVDLAKEALKVNEETLNIVKKEKHKSLAYRFWSWIIGIATIGSFVIAIIALLQSCS